MLFQSSSLVAIGLFAHSIVAQIIGAQTVLYLANCVLDGTNVAQVAEYNNYLNSQNGEAPDNFANGPYVAWEGGPVTTWNLGNGITVLEAVDANAQDPSVPFTGHAGCGYMEVINGGAAAAEQFTCFKDNLHPLYSTADINCVSVYYCLILQAGDSCACMKHHETMGSV
jgi:hypothetical protein